MWCGDWVMMDYVDIMDDSQKMRSFARLLVLLQDFLSVLVVQSPDVHELLCLCLQFTHAPLQFLRLGLPLLQVVMAELQSRPCLLFLQADCSCFLLQCPYALLCEFQLLCLFLGALSVESSLQCTHVFLPLSQLSLLFLQFLFQSLDHSIVVRIVSPNLLQGLLYCTTSANLIQQLMVLSQQMQFLCCSLVDCLQFIMLSTQILILIGPLVAKPFQPLVLLQQLQDTIVTFFAFGPLKEGLLSDCLHERLQDLLLLGIKGQHAFDESTFSRTQGKIQYQQAGLYEIFVVGSDRRAFPSDALLKTGEVVVVEGVTQGGVCLTSPLVKHRPKTPSVHLHQHKSHCPQSISALLVDDLHGQCQQCPRQLLNSLHIISVNYEHERKGDHVLSKQLLALRCTSFFWVCRKRQLEETYLKWSPIRNTGLRPYRRYFTGMALPDRIYCVFQARISTTIMARSGQYTVNSAYRLSFVQQPEPQALEANRLLASSSLLLPRRNIQRKYLPLAFAGSGLTIQFCPDMALTASENWGASKFLEQSVLGFRRHIQGGLTTQPHCAPPPSRNKL